MTLLPLLPALLAGCTGGASKEPDRGDTHQADTSSSEADTDTDGDTDTDSDSDTDSDADDTAAVPVDLDADGYLDDVDCDDADASVHPSAEDFCERIDQDCDGVSWALGSCGEVLMYTEVSEQVSVDNSAYLVRDLTGDGLPDWLVWSQGFPRPDGEGEQYGFALYAGGEVPASPLDAPTEALQGWVLGSYSAFLALDPKDVGDLDGDGTNDVLFVSEGQWSMMWVHLGPLTLDGSLDWVESSDELWTGRQPNYETWMAATAQGVDFDGDGRNDLAGSESAQSGDSDFSSFDVFFGGSWGDSAIRVMTEGDQSARQLDTLEDIDGDGLADLHVSGAAADGYTWHYLVSGADLRGADGIIVDDLAFARAQAYQGNTAFFDDYWGTAGDWTGDGTPDMIVADHNSETLGYEHGEVFVFDGSAARGEILVEDAVGSWVGNVVDEQLYCKANLDADGEPGQELLLYADGDAVYLVQHALPAMRTPVSGMRFQIEDHQPYTRGQPQDFDGDGFDDWAFTDYTTDPTTARLWFGWAIPWDDPTAWAAP
jgi:hypothetical protein